MPFYVSSTYYYVQLQLDCILPATRLLPTPLAIIIDIVVLWSPLLPVTTTTTTRAAANATTTTTSAAIGAATTNVVAVSSFCEGSGSG